MGVLKELLGGEVVGWGVLKGRLLGGTSVGLGVLKELLGGKLVGLGILEGELLEDGFSRRIEESIEKHELLNGVYHIDTVVPGKARSSRIMDPIRSFSFSLAFSISFFDLFASWRANCGNKV